MVRVFFSLAEAESCKKVFLYFFSEVHNEQEGARQEAIGGHRAQAAEGAHLTERRRVVEQQCKLNNNRNQIY